MLTRTRLRQINVPLRSFAATLACLLTFAAVAQADTIAYWRFEDQYSVGNSFGTLEGTNGGSPYTTTQDYSGNGNALRTFNNALNAPFTGTSPEFGNGGGPATTIPQTGAPNDKWAYFAGGQDIYTDPLNPAGPNNLNSYNFSGNFTIQASIYSNTPAASPSNLQAFHTFLGKDNPLANGGNPLALLYFQQTNAGYLGFSAYDSNAVFQTVSTTYNISNTDNSWTNVALVASGSTWTLYAEAAGAGSYTQVGQITGVTPGLFNASDTWSVGRGQFAGAPADSWIGGIDEVKIDNVALDPSQFLFSVAEVPEPATFLAGACALGACAASFLSRRFRTKACYGVES